MRPGLLVGLLVTGFALPVHGQTVTASADGVTHLTRAQLEQMLAQAEQHATTRSSDASGHRALAEANAIRARLATGDLQVGDRVVISVEGLPQLTDTFTVASGRVLQLPEVGQIPLAGVLRSELAAHLTEAVGRVFRNVSLTARALVRLEIMGAVGRPGFYTLGSDMLLSDVLMIAGGLSNRSNLDRIRIERASETILAGNEVRSAINAGRTLDQLSIQPGDRITIPEKSSGMDKLQRGLMVVSGLATLVFLVTRGSPW